ncbi:MAG: hypothetical protein LBD75_03475 [Candidatus Peribacteria bacterium]|jgi:hypothetical protein|nr:hypothetical protein [Candidatus Peribacteria bacterium]
MKKIKIFATLTLIVLIVCGLVSSCSKKVDPIHGTQPVNTEFARNFPLDEFHQAGIAGDTTTQKQLVEQYRKQLTRNVLSQYPCVQEANIRFILGSGFAKDVASGDGKYYSGKFKNELIIVINDPCKKDTLFLACGNGMLSSLRLDHQSDWGNGAQCRFTIQKGEGIAHYKPALDEWASVAGELKIPIKNSKGEIVSEETYRNYLDKKYQGILFPGDVLDLCAGKVYNINGQEVDFSRRIQETEKANAKLARTPKKTLKISVKKDKKKK